MNKARDNLLEINDLAIAFHTDDGLVPAVSDVSFSVPACKTVALLGESGCGKSVTARAIMNFIEAPGRLEKGSIRLRRDEGWVSILDLNKSGEEMRRIRWKEISMIFQDPMNSLTPAYTVGDQIVEAIRLHRKLSEEEARQIAIDLLAEVGVPAPQRRVDDYPHQMSGGMCQRAMIAMALSCNPRLIIADEPTTALDVTIQAQVLELLRKTQRVHETSILLITHDMGVVAEMADEVVVMYLGRIVEKGPVREVFNHPKHPYTQRLFASVPRPDISRDTDLPSIPGAVPDHLHIPEGCPFRGRCHEEMKICARAPVEVTVSPEHTAACWLHLEDDS
ncbi:MAG: ABC transporter ATP-binding protein [Verrucomicrobia bacterium]|nr:ABC transporter ATP-binding protein [Verrucomicrobiota bacterium]